MYREQSGGGGERENCYVEICIREGSILKTLIEIQGTYYIGLS